MKFIQTILNGLDKAQDVVHIIKAFLAGVETFTNELKNYKDGTNK